MALLKGSAPVCFHGSRHAKVAPLGSMVFLLPTDTITLSGLSGLCVRTASADRLCRDGRRQSDETRKSHKKVLDKHPAVCDTDAVPETVNHAFTNGTLTIEEWKAEMELDGPKH
ncbi:MAG: hypothetical protein PVSMB2_38430 [Ktedonobacteraceae bacterium]